MENDDVFVMPAYKEPDFDGLIDPDILARFSDGTVYNGDIINAQLIKEIRTLIKVLRDEE